MSLNPSTKDPVGNGFSPQLEWGGRSVRLYSSHDTEHQGREVVNVIAEYLQKVPKDVPGIVLLEHPFPGVETKPDALQSLLDARVADLKGPVHDHLKNWRDHILKDPPPRELVNFLHNYWSEVITKTYSPQRVLVTNPFFSESGGMPLLSHPFCSNVIKGVQALGGDGRTLYFLQERPRFDAWVYTAQKEVFDLFSFADLLDRDITGSLSYRRNATSSFIKSNKYRDEGNVLLIEQACKQWPDALLFSIFGSNHFSTQQAGFANCVRSDEARQLHPPRLGPRSACNLLEPLSAFGPAALADALRSLFADSLSISFAGKDPLKGTRLVTPLAEAIFELSVGITELELMEWANRCHSPGKKGVDLIETVTFEWLRTKPELQKLVGSVAELRASHGLA